MSKKRTIWVVALIVGLGVVVGTGTLAAAATNVQETDLS